jgi:uncharacterized protein YjaZ
MGYTITNVVEQKQYPNTDNLFDHLFSKVDKILPNGGFESDVLLKEKFATFIDTSQSTVFSDNLSLNTIQRIEEGLQLSQKVIQNPNHIYIFLYSTSSEFVLKYMNGVVGWCPSNNAIHLFVHPNYDPTSLIETVIHEFNHTIFRNHHRWNTVKEGLVAEGLAEHFREELVGGERAPWTRVLNKKESSKWLYTIKPILNSRSAQDYSNVFTNFEADPYPLWTGYALGYYIIENYRTLYPSNWDKLMETNVDIIVNSFV